MKSYNDAYEMAIYLITLKENIILIGPGCNGKTTLIRQLKHNNKLDDYTILNPEYDPQTNTIDLKKEKFITEANVYKDLVKFNSYRYKIVDMSHIHFSNDRPATN